MERLLIPELGHLVQQARDERRRFALSAGSVRRVDDFARRERDRSGLTSTDVARRLGRADRARAARGGAPGRVAAADVTSPIDVPPFARSAMDGYAVRRRRHRGRDALGAGRCACSIASTPGSLVARPSNAARARRSRPALRSRRARTRSSWSRRRPRATEHDDRRLRARRRPGSTSAAAAPTSPRAIASIAAGDVLVPEPHRRASPRSAARDVEVFAKPRVAILSTGNEVVEPGGTLAPGQIYDVNRFTLGAIVAAHGGDRRAASRGAGHGRRARRRARRLRGRRPDRVFRRQFGRRARSRRRRHRGARRDDLSRHRGAAGQADGICQHRRQDGSTPFFGMPGNPTSCLSNAYILLVPFLRALARLPPHAPRDRPRAARPPHRVSGQPASVLHGAPARRRGVPGVQRIGRHHEPVAGRRLHRDSRRSRASLKRGPC